MSISQDDFAMLVEQALANLRAGPKNLASAIDFVARSNDMDVPSPLDRLVTQLKSSGPNDRIRHVLTSKLQPWDHVDSPVWSSKTAPHSEERRADALRLLGFSVSDNQLINSVIKIFKETDVPIVIAEDHERWYEQRKNRSKRLYWDDYTTQLAIPRGTWNGDAITKLDLSTDDVIARLSDPTRLEIYQVKGLVMGYVQSGKTSHFSGLIAKAADAGYRLIIVLAGTMDILRQQTQRRIDKEIIGKELLGAEEYGTDANWSGFVEHKGRPSELGSFDWNRLTNRDDDYTSLRQHLHVLEFKRTYTDKPFNHPDNLRNAPAKLAVIKKTPKRVEKLCIDLKKLKELRSVLEHVPTLIIDDESDQASINTIKQQQPGAAKKRTSTNKVIGDLLRILPRAQYVGYTATPFANVFIDPNDADDLFPKDFIVSLPRPDGYMGASDFYDFDADLQEEKFLSNKAAFVRPVEGDNDDEKNLPAAIDSFVLAGAIKLYRRARDPKQYDFRHHTMLVHHSARKAVHEGDAEEVRAIFKGGARYQTSGGLDRLKKLFEKDFAPVSKIRAKNDPYPKSFGDLKNYIIDCVSKICDEKPVLIVNGDNRDDTPDFDQKPVWAILVGGAKLSRGYTVEGLTTSYYRRPAGAADTLMQMGRWFGFRPGYRDLVRLYVGKNERKGKVNIDLYEAFGAVCRDEEALRAELLRYKNGLKPRQVPPLVHQHLPQLPPTSKNKMFNAQIKAKNFAGEWTEKTSAPIKPSDQDHNLQLLTQLLARLTSYGLQDLSLTNNDKVNRKSKAYVGIVESDAVAEFLSEYKWSGNKRSVQLETEYIDSQRKNGNLKQWVVLLPQVTGKADPYRNKDCVFPELAVVARGRVTDTRFGVYSEPRHREVAEYLAGVREASNVSNFLSTHRDSKRPILVLYLVSDEKNPKAQLSVGFGIQFPGQKKSDAIVWTIADPDRAGEVVVKIPR